jgi:hypothetical protein
MRYRAGRLFPGLFFGVIDEEVEGDSSSKESPPVWRKSIANQKRSKEICNHDRHHCLSLKHMRIRFLSLFSTLKPQ